MFFKQHTEMRSNYCHEKKMINLPVAKLKEKIQEHKYNKRNISKRKLEFFWVKSHFPNSIRIHTHTHTPPLVEHQEFYQCSV